MESWNGCSHRHDADIRNHTRYPTYEDQVSQQHWEPGRLSWSEHAYAERETERLLRLLAIRLNPSSPVVKIVRRV
jgi:hypothetical protein